MILRVTVTGEVVGEHVHDNDLVVNVTKAKQLTNVRASGSDDTFSFSVLACVLDASSDDAVSFA